MRKASTRRWKASATRRAPAARSRARRARSSRSRRTQARESLRQAGDAFEGYTDTSVKGIPVLALFDAKKKPVEALE